MPIRAACLYFGFALATALANPSIIFHESYIESEDLTITVDGEYANFLGNFVFRSSRNAPENETELAACIEVPIWVPAHSDEVNGPIARFLATFPTKKLAWIKPETRPLVDEVIGLTIKAGDKLVPYKTFPSYAYGERGVSRAWTRQDVRCVYFREFFDSSSLKDGAKIVLTYRQPLIRVGEKRLLFYVPIFRNLSPELLRMNLKNYHITVQCSPGETLSATSELTYYAANSSHQLHVLPEHERAIEIEIEKADQPSDPAPTAVHPSAGQNARLL